MRTTIKDQHQAHAVRHVAFSEFDEKGREIGANITKGVHEFIEQPDDHACFYDRAPGSYFYFCPQATRNGKRYGACQSDQYFTNERDRDVAIERYLANAQKRAAKMKTRSA